MTLTQSGTDAFALLPFGDDDLHQAMNRLYLAVLQNPGSSRPWLLAREERVDLVDAALRGLEQRGLVTVHRDGMIEVAPPDVALPTAAAALERQGQALRAITMEFVELYRAARLGAAPASPALQLLDTVDEISRTVYRLGGSIVDEVKIVRAPTFRNRHLLAVPVEPVGPEVTERSEGMLYSKVIYDPLLLDHPAALAVLEARGARGEQARFLNALPVSIFVAPGMGAVIDATLDEAAGGVGLLVTAPALVTAFESLVDRLWDLATPLPARGSAMPIDTRDQAILLLLASGATDAAIARHLTISQRTVERRIRALLEQLGVTTRFQAGVQAARRGWI